jgi:molybdopterin-guanine dinucleotide biosynthesis protein A
MQRTRSSRAGFVLAGGQSTRMGEDKAFLRFENETLVSRALRVMHKVCSQVAVVGDPAKFAGFAPPAFALVVADIFPGCGPLAGIHSALTCSTTDLNLMLAVDMPFVTTELLDLLFAAAEENDSAIATVPRTMRGLQPLCAVYRRDFASVAEKALREGTYRIDATFSNLAVNVISVDQLAQAGFSEKNFFNLNTPQDHAEANQTIL